MIESSEPNCFGRLLEVMTTIEIALYIKRLELKGEVRVAEILRDELLDRAWLASSNTHPQISQSE